MTHRMNLAAVAGTVGLLIGSMAFAHAAGLSVADKAFMKKAAAGGIAEVKLGELAAKQGSSQGVKDFGQKMVEDHTKANDELKSIAATKSVTLPADADAKSKSIMAKLEKLHGAAFDAAYIKAMKGDHKNDLAEFKKEANGGSDSDVKGFAAKTTPVIAEHYKMISGMGTGNGSKMSSGKM